MDATTYETRMEQALAMATMLQDMGIGPDKMPMSDDDRWLMIAQWVGVPVPDHPTRADVLWLLREFAG